MRLTRTPVPPKHLISPDPQNSGEEQTRSTLIDCLLQNRISLSQLDELRRGSPPNYRGIVADELSNIIQRIYDMNEKYILDISTVDGLLRTFNQFKNVKRNKRFERKIKSGFRTLDDKSKKVILAEGDSWFNYPILLTDIVDRISMEKNMALYSLASGGDWFLNMLSGRQYVEELSVLHPDVFLISGGGNDLVGSRRLAAIVEPSVQSVEYSHSEWAKRLIDKAKKREGEKKYTPLDEARFDKGSKYLSKDFFALLMFFHLQYYFLIDGILGKDSNPAKFPGIKIITQGYDYPLPSYSKHYGWNPTLWYVPFIRTFLGHGGWLRTPLQIRGIVNNEVQKDILYAMIYLFNEMMIEIGSLFKDRGQVFHIDSRDFVGEKGWTDELHAKPQKQMKIGEVFIRCINGESASYDSVYVVNQF